MRPTSTKVVIPKESSSITLTCQAKDEIRFDFIPGTFKVNLNPTINSKYNHTISGNTLSSYGTVSCLNKNKVLHEWSFSKQGKECTAERFSLKNKTGFLKVLNKICNFIIFQILL